ncbi:TatD family hydrolase [Thermus filiformis]|uniref:Hydrolase TatD n=1 Tax=Thermus filiformis TaxID=276 RepID=A0A0A2WQU9_THEFI|nr:TatD family hydrolase [Thermus filiformis]KGQ21127.2 hydrolase TatD [Thermus filiformis]
MTDTHAHLDFLEPEELEEVRLDELLAVLTLGIDPARWERTLELAQGNVYAAVGLHPTEAHLLSPEVEEALRHYARHARVRAIGESGLDYYWTPETKAAQLRALDFQAALAEELGLPLVLHVRSRDGKAEEELAHWLLLHRPKRVVLHAYGGHPDLERAGLEVGAYFSFAGPLTYPKNAALKEAARRLPRERLLLETDTPFLPPVPHRGKRNRPQYVRHTLEALAEALGMPFLEAERLTDQNAARLFRWDNGGV